MTVWSCLCSREQSHVCLSFVEIQTKLIDHHTGAQIAQSKYECTWFKCIYLVHEIDKIFVHAEASRRDAID